MAEVAELVGFAEAFASGLAGVLAEVAPILDERQRRVLLGAGARCLGRGGITLVAAATGASVDTVGRGAAELEAGVVADGRVRAKGAGRPAVEEKDPWVWPALERLVDPETRGDPMSPLRWTTKSTVKLADELTEQGHRVGPRTVARLLRDHDYSLQGNAKKIEGKQHPDRDAQFRYLNSQVTAFLEAGLPVISVDTTKKENVGRYSNGGVEYQRKGEPEPTNTYDFIGELGKAVPYGVYDVGANAGWVNVGTDADTGAFAVESIRRWWFKIGRPCYPEATTLLITADGGGSNGARLRLWKTQLAQLAAETGLQIAVCHLPPGTSKWNKIEHRMFSAITMNWRGRPLETHEVVVETIAATTTKTGLTVQAMLDTNTYEKGIKIADKEMKAFEARHLQRHDFHGDWNYTITAAPSRDTTHPDHQD
jgi:Rhodopirellula transposase DDE domain